MNSAIAGPNERSSVWCSSSTGDGDHFHYNVCRGPRSRDEGRPTWQNKPCRLSSYAIYHVVHLIPSHWDFLYPTASWAPKKARPPPIKLVHIPLECRLMVTLIVLVARALWRPWPKSLRTLPLLGNRTVVLLYTFLEQRLAISYQTKLCFPPTHTHKT